MTPVGYARVCMHMYARGRGRGANAGADADAGAAKCACESRVRCECGTGASGVQCACIARAYGRPIGPLCPASSVRHIHARQWTMDVVWCPLSTIFLTDVGRRATSHVQCPKRFARSIDRGQCPTCPVSNLHYFLCGRLTRDIVWCLPSN